MAALPYALSDKTSVQVLSNVRVSQATDGTLRYLDLGGTTWSKIACVVEGLSDAERVGLMAFLATNETSEIDVDISGVTYRGRLLPSEAPAWSQSSGINMVSFGLQAKAV